MNTSMVTRSNKYKLKPQLLLRFYEILLFTKKLNLNNYTISFCGLEVELSSQVKYLGLIFDQELHEKPVPKQHPIAQDWACAIG